MERRTFIGSTLGIMGGLAFRIKTVPRHNPEFDYKANTQYTGVYHTDKGDIPVPIESIERVGFEFAPGSKVAFRCKKVDALTMSLQVNAISLLSPDNKKIGTQRFADGPICMISGDTLHGTYTLKYRDVE